MIPLSNEDVTLFFHGESLGESFAQIEGVVEVEEMSGAPVPNAFPEQGLRSRDR
jgi:hypothetical protein